MTVYTPVYGWPYQQLFDAPDGASLGEDLALAIEATLNGLITGSIGGPIADLQADITALETATSHYGCRLKKLAQAIPNGGSATVVSYDTELEDTNGFWTPAAPTIITIPSNGTYTFSYVGLLSGTPTAARNLLSINLTASTLPSPPNMWRSVFGVSEQFVCTGGSWDLNAGDTLTCDVFHSNAAPLNWDAYFSIHRNNPR